MLTSKSSNPLLVDAAKPKKEAHSKKPNATAVTPSMRIELVTPGSYNTPETIEQVPTLPAGNNEAPVVAKQTIPLVQIDRAEVVAQPDIGFSDLSLPDGIRKPNPGVLSTMSPVTRTELEGMIGHRFAYKQYAAMERLRKLRLAGSEDLLRRGLSHRKFWTRMEALFGLAEIGAQLSPADLQTAIGSSRPYLQKSYFKRFERGLWGGGMFYQGPNSAEKYILSLCMYFVNEQAQAVISKALRS